MKDAQSIVVVQGEEPLLSEWQTICEHHGIYTGPRAKKHPVAGFELTNTDITQKKSRLLALEKSLPDTVPVFSSSVTCTIAEQSRWLKNPSRLFGISALPTLLSAPLIEVTPSLTAPMESVHTAKAFFASVGKEISIVQDRIGMVMPRILCMVINEAYFACTEDIAHPSDIDLAMKLGTNYPLGPIEWSQKITAKQIVAVLSAIHADTGEERYRVAPLLRALSMQEQ